MALLARILGARLVKTPDWIMRPGEVEARSCWPTVQGIYHDLTAQELPDVMPLRERRKLDAVFEVAGNRRIFEFDGGQHFNGDRATTLRAYPDVSLAFPHEVWLARSQEKARIKTGGWARACPPLFPDPGGGHQQRAFRDAIADLLPLEYGYEPTLRIGFFEIDWLGTTREEDECHRVLASRVTFSCLDRVEDDDRVASESVVAVGEDGDEPQPGRCSTKRLGRGQCIWVIERWFSKRCTSGR